MKNHFLYAALVFIGVVSSCTKDEVYKEGTTPEWLGESIYEELRNPSTTASGSNLSGTFNTYLRLVDDIGYKEVLSTTGSKTVFVANDSAFNVFFASGKMLKEDGSAVTCYEDLTFAQKQLLVFSSMIDNALLIEMLGNSSYNNAIVKNVALKHATAINQKRQGVKNVWSYNMPGGNTYWDEARKKGAIWAVFDDTNPPLIHFTKEYMIGSNMTTDGENSDFEVLTGSKYDSENQSAFVFNNKVINSNITCQNGYIHQLDNVLVPPGNIAEVLRSDKTQDTGTRYFSRVLDYFSVPVLMSETEKNNYNEYAKTHEADGLSQVDALYSVRYFSTKSQGAQSFLKLDGEADHLGNTYLDWDPGWNEYYVTGTGGLDLADIGVIFAPNDKAMWEHFGPGGSGADIIGRYGSGKPNTLDNFEENLDSVQSKAPTIFPMYVKNLMKTSLASAVPSKFKDIEDDAQELMGVSLGSIADRADGKKDVVIANNGVVYKTNKVFQPSLFRSVLAPVTLYQDNMMVMYQMLNDKSENGNRALLEADMYYKLISMQSHFGVIVPDDQALQSYYVDPTSIYNTDTETESGTDQPHALLFAYDPTMKGDAKKVTVQKYNYNTTTRTVGSLIDETPIPTISEKNYNSLIVDLLNSHVVVFDNDENFETSGRHFFKTAEKLGAIYYDPAAKTFSSSYDIANQISTVQSSYNKDNGSTYIVNHAIQPNIYSVKYRLKQVGSFSSFLDLCEGLSTYTDQMLWAGISAEKSALTGLSEIDQMAIFSTMDNKCLDENVRMLKGYNYTLYVPTNTAIQSAVLNLGLPTWDDVLNLYKKYYDTDGSSWTRKEVDGEPIPETEAEEEDKATAKKIIEAIRDFTHYHFHNTAVFADTGANGVETGTYETLLTDAKLSIAQKVTVTCPSEGTLRVTDGANVSHDVHYGGANSNIMAREYIFDKDKYSASKIDSKTFVVIHGVDNVLRQSTGRYDTGWK